MKGYVTPWDIWYRNQTGFQPTYTIINGNEGYSPYIMEVTPYIGLAYYDDIEDGDYTDLQTNIIVANLNNGNYPNLYANGAEAGNVIAAKPITMLADGTPGEGEVAIGSTTDHLPGDTSPLGPGYNPLGKKFVFQGLVTPQEYQLLLEYGKVFYYNVKLINKTTGLIDVDVNLQLENLVLDQLGNPLNLWRQLPYQSPIVNVGAVDVYYYKSASGNGTLWPNNPGQVQPNLNFVECDSREITFKGFANWEEKYPGIVILRFKSVPGTSLWQNAGLHLTFSPY